MRRGIVATYKEIVTKAVIGKGKKVYTDIVWDIYVCFNDISLFDHNSIIFVFLLASLEDKIFFFLEKSTLTMYCFSIV